ncbi:hypothetical protein GUJ93_ZPchr0011g27989 [Zizania palustris]|uniref:Leucine-rich repeat-containing N-terminal plant-type domain-containing protein n=1 Tax=Zizania palustris TaxID=103762 RepID=A0A8J5WK19_ZIZPA|nr:hypothetical protein GUJ93_ZPchr0011g27989 [Zizania palustris]
MSRQGFQPLRPFLPKHPRPRPCLHFAIVGRTVTTKTKTLPLPPFRYILLQSIPHAGSAQTPQNPSPTGPPPRRAPATGGDSMHMVALLRLRLGFLLLLVLAPRPVALVASDRSALLAFRASLSPPSRAALASWRGPLSALWLGVSLYPSASTEAAPPVLAEPRAPATEAGTLVEASRSGRRCP